jgi:hypothetical protein
MRIFSSTTGDPMLLDREGGLHTLGSELREFVGSSFGARSFSAETTGSAEPYTEFLYGLRVEKLEGGVPKARVADDRWLELKASASDLEGLCERLAKLRNGEHTHFHAAPVSLVLEADDTWPGFANEG